MKGVQYSISWVDQKALVGLNRALIMAHEHMAKSTWAKMRPGPDEETGSLQCSRTLCQVTGTCQHPARAGIAETLVGSHTDCCVRDPVLSSNGERILRFW